MATSEEIRKAQRAEGVANILSIGTATPSNCISQSDYPDYNFRVTNSNHMTDLKHKFKRMCTNNYMHKLVFVNACKKKKSVWVSHLLFLF